MTVSDDPQAFRGVGQPDLDTVTCREDLAKLLAERQARADVSLRELELRAERAGGARLPRATCADMLAGRRFPKKAVMVAFLRACQVPEEQIPVWERAWERIKLAQTVTAQVSTARPSGAEQDTATSRRSPGSPGVSEDVSKGISAAEDGGAATGQDTQPGTSGLVRGPKRLWRRTGLLVGLAAATGLAAVVGVVVFEVSDPPPLRTVFDDGRAFGKGGSSQFTVTVDPAHSEIRLTRRLDAIIAMQTATISVNGALAAVWQPLHGESRGWRDQSVTLPPALTLGSRSLTITNAFVSSDWDFNEFVYIVDQKIKGVWSRADVVDVGPNHPESEAAHHYRITKQSWAGARSLSYLN